MLQCVAVSPGTGKSHLLEAIGHHAMDQGLSVAWFSVEELDRTVRRHRVDDRPQPWGGRGTLVQFLRESSAWLDRLGVQRTEKGQAPCPVSGAAPGLVASRC